MKVFLTEGQLNRLIFEEQLKNLDSILEGDERGNAKKIANKLFGEKDLKTIYNTIAGQLKKKSISFMAVPLILGMVIGGGVERAGVREKLTQKLATVWQQVKNMDKEVTDAMKADLTDPHFKEKVEALKAYMETAAKNQSYDPNSILITPEAMIKACNQTDFDLPLLIAQAHLESCFGLTPRARKTNSVFSVGSYDNGKNVATYDTQDDCILPYINLMKNNYLRDRSVDDLLKPGSFVNGQNLRYASDKAYENKVKSIRNRIISKYPILGT